MSNTDFKSVCARGSLYVETECAAGSSHVRRALYSVLVAEDMESWLLLRMRGKTHTFS